MNKITREEFKKFTNELYTGISVGWPAFFDRFWSRIQEVQSSEPMSVDQIEPYLRMAFCDKFGMAQPTTEWMDALLKMAKAVQPLTVQQGFVVDWSKAPSWAQGVRIIFDDGQAWIGGPEGKCFPPQGRWFKTIEYHNRPTPKATPRTTGEKCADLIHRITTMLDPDEIDELCKAAGIPIEVTE